MQIAFTVETDRYSDDFLAFAAAAVNAQAEEFCSAWRLKFVPVAFYRRATTFDGDVAHAIAVVDDLQAPGLLGFHEFVGGAAVGRVAALEPDEMTACFSHEVAEIIADPECNIWRPMPGGGFVAQEVSDPVQADTYEMPVAVLGETRAVRVSNYVFPSWFQVDGKPPFDRMGLLRAPFEMRPGGYIIFRDGLGIRNVFHDGAMPPEFARKMANARSRTMKRLRTA